MKITDYFKKIYLNYLEWRLEKLEDKKDKTNKKIKTYKDELVRDKDDFHGTVVFGRLETITSLDEILREKIIKLTQKIVKLKDN